MTADEFRRAALALPGVVEAAHMNHPDFRVKGKIFASLGVPDECWGMVKLTPERQRSFIERAPAVFRPCSGAWGRQGYTNIHLASANKNILNAALEAAFKNITSPAKTGSAATSERRPKIPSPRLNRATVAEC